MFPERSTHCVQKLYVPLPVNDTCGCWDGGGHVMTAGFDRASKSYHQVTYSDLGRGDNAQCYYRQ